jgi:hypothetical protein
MGFLYGEGVRRGEKHASWPEGSFDPTSVMRSLAL